MRGTVGTKILGSFAVVMAFTLALAAYGAYRDAELRDTLELLQVRGLEAMRAAGRASMLAERIRSRHFMHAATESPVELADIERQMNEFDRDLDSALRDLDRALEGGELRQRLPRIREAITAWRAARANVFLPASRTQDTPAAIALMLREVSPHYLRAIDDLERLVDDTAALADARYETARATLETSRTITFAAAIIDALLAILLGVWLTNDIARRVRDVAAAARAVTSGDLSRRANVTGRDEISDLASAFDTMAETIERKVSSEQASARTQRDEKDALARAVARYGSFVGSIARGDLTQKVHAEGDGDLAALGRDLGTMGDALRRMTGGVAEAVGALSSATAELMATAQEQSASAAEAAAAVTETVSTVDELTQTSRTSSDRAREVADAARRSVDASDAGRIAVDGSITAMERVQAQMSAIAERILGLSEQAQRVGQIVAAVGDLAEQSNLLALNAAIEAARAGEHGRSFAVVAQEVRSLAEQSKRATVQVRGILAEIEKSTTQAVLVTEQGGKAASEAMRTVHEAGQRIEQLASVIAESAGAGQQIATTAQQQVTGVSQIAQAMHSINQAATQSVEATRQTERAARDLGALSDRLRSAIAQYRT
ncbi:HAMP domain-containing methyl-accepting chemotaxis protein [Sandaracinus amylolyticus]|uniref:HAMP domain-containing methyl-accepting chemotaxis protein n=1 Tax=Sandaracinus amylolyticus TaxID=927083 RepID=UPI001F010D29|nr:methyl-accepting chemotaxis protein [Sandaracinus amylolyticus]UJR81323.1 Methyl-accepting chemotaxis sensory transducer [Sandaracinus amylolyticus]